MRWRPPARLTRRPHPRRRHALRLGSRTADDVNPSSRTAPCKTFAGAISKTAAGGEINCLDPGGYGAVTICLHTEGGAIAGADGIVVNDGATATPHTTVVTIRSLDIFGVNPPTNGVRFVAGAALHFEDSRIQCFNAANSFGVQFTPNASAKLYISNTTIAGNGSGSGSTGGGIDITPAVNAVARVFSVTSTSATTPRTPSAPAM